MTPKFISLPEGLNKHISKEDSLKIQKRNSEKELKNHKNRVSILENQFANYLLALKLKFKFTLDYENTVNNTKN